MGYNESYKQRITKIKSLLDTNKQTILGIINNYKNNINDINTKINSITNKNWIDDVETEYSDYIDYLKTGIILKLNNSVDSIDGSLTTFEKLIKDLEEKCNDYLNAISNVETAYWSIAFDENNNSFKAIDNPDRDNDEIPDNEEDLASLNNDFANIVTNIDEILKQLKELRFESVTAYESTKDYDFSSLKKEEPKKKKKKQEENKTDNNNEIPQPKGHTFESPDDAWILIKDNTKTYMEGKTDPLTGIRTPDSGEHQLWAYNTVSGELVPIGDDDKKLNFGFIHSDYTVTLPNGKTVKTDTLDPAYNGVSEHIKKYYPESLQDKWVLSRVDSSEEANKKIYEQVQEETGKPIDIKVADIYVFYNPITGERVETTVAKVEEKKDKYIIESEGETYIVYKDNYVEWDLENYKRYNEIKDQPVIRAAN